MASTLSETEICNLALAKIGNAEGYLTSLETDTTEAGQACRRVYSAMRDEVIESQPWRFAIGRAALAASSATPIWGYDRAFAKPSDFLRMVSTEDDQADYEDEGDYILSDASAPLNVRYLRRITDTSKFTPTFVSALATRIAVEICEPITKSTAKRDSLWTEYKALVRQARRTDMMGAAQTLAPDGDWNNARL